MLALDEFKERMDKLNQKVTATNLKLDRIIELLESIGQAHRPCKDSDGCDCCDRHA